jgi:phage shock protein A
MLAPSTTCSYDSATSSSSVTATIEQLKEARRAATQELIAFKAGEKVMAARAEELGREAEGWQARAETAVRAGDDELAKEALVRRGWAVAELAQLRADIDEQRRMAVDLLKARKELDAKLAALEARAGTVQGGLDALDRAETERQVFERFDEAERRIEQESIEGELSAGEIEASELAQQSVRELEKGIQADVALEDLKKKMRGD